ncbi:lactose ABC transporter permease [Clostridia bacterium]|nr:lactose ABC transporter permease [Clostridia bacterium]
MKKIRIKPLTIKQRRARNGLLFILPWLIGFLWFYIRSFAQSIQFSLSDITVNMQVGGYTLRYAGLKYYDYLFSVHGSFKQVFADSIVEILIDIPLIIFFSLFMAVMLNGKFRGCTFSRVIFFLPVVLNSQAISNALGLAQSTMSGGITTSSSIILSSAVDGGHDLGYYLYIFSQLGIPAPLINYVLGAVSRVTEVITASGVQIVLFLAGLQAIDPALYEVSKIEGATSYETFWKVTMPMVSPIIVTCIVYTVVDAFAKSGLLDLSYATTFNEINYPLGSAISLVGTVAMCLILWIICSVISKRTYYIN